MDTKTQDLPRRVAQADAWCSRRVQFDDLKHCARTPALRPPLSANGHPVISGPSVDDVAARRASGLRADGIEPTSLAAPDGGRMLAFDPGQSLGDGAAAAESQGFFDDDNTPPWDTWLMFVEETPRSADRWSAFDSYLLCWIPAALVDVVSRAVEANPEQCLRWADELRTPWLDGLRATGGV